MSFHFFFSGEKERSKFSKSFKGLRWKMILAQDIEKYLIWGPWVGIETDTFLDISWKKSYSLRNYFLISICPPHLCLFTEHRERPCSYMYGKPVFLKRRGENYLDSRSHMTKMQGKNKKTKAKRSIHLTRYTTLA